MTVRFDSIKNVRLPGVLLVVGLGMVLTLNLGAQPVSSRMGKSPQHKKRMGKAPETDNGRQDTEPTDYASTAQSYLDQAKEAEDPTQRGSLQLQAAKSLIKGKYYEQAKSILAGVDTSSLTENLQYAYRLLSAEVALSEQNPKKALGFATKPDRTIPDGLRIQSHLIRARAFSQLGNRIQGLQELFSAEKFAQADELKQVHAAIWKTVQPIPQAGLKSLLQQSDSKAMSGWIELAMLYKESSSSPDQFNTKLEQWKQKYAGHVAADSVVGTLTEKLKNVQQRPSRLALLLPLQGRISRASSAIRDGFIAAHFSGSNDRKKIQIRIYDTKGKNIGKVYDQAVANGAEFVIGPLLKGNVRRLANRGALSVPVLALNILKHNSGVTNMYFFGLTPEDEARQVAERAIFDNRTQAIAFVPDTGWGGRVLRAFKERYLQLGGKLLSHGTYKLSQSDYSRTLKALLKLNESKDRYNELRSALDSVKIHFTPRRRHDADFIFIAAHPRSARLIAPQLRFYHAKNLPIYATSHAYKGVENKRQDVELNGLIFCDIPWTLGHSGQPSSTKLAIEKLWPNKIIDYSRFYALGADAYNIIPYLQWLKEQPYERFDGHTGKLSVDKNNKIKRTLQWAKIINGKATVIQDRTESSLPNASAARK